MQIEVCPLAELPPGTMKLVSAGLIDIGVYNCGGTLYAIVLAPPADGKVSVRSLRRGQPHLPGEIQSVELLGSTVALQWKRDAAGLQVQLPATPSGAYALALRITPR